MRWFIVLIADPNRQKVVYHQNCKKQSKLQPRVPAATPFKQLLSHPFTTHTHFEWAILYTDNLFTYCAQFYSHARELIFSIVIFGAVTISFFFVLAYLG